mgnify:CR=1 FL=1
MEAIRRFVKVKNHQVNITLPEDFNAEEVEVIILSSSKEYQIPQWQIDEVRERTEKYLKNPESATDIEDFILTEEDKKMLDFRANQPREDFVSAKKAIENLKKKYGI